MDYGKIKAVNWSSLKHMHKSPLEYKWRTEHPEPRKPEYLLGSAIHCRVLEPDELENRYALCEVRRNKRDMKYKDWLEENEGKEALNAKEWDHVHRSGLAVLNHRVAAEVLDGCRCEEPLSWDDPDTGLQCKGRVDAIGPRYVVDLKTSKDPSPRAFTRDAASYMYHGQMSLYHTGATAMGKTDGKEMPYIIAVAKEPPYDVAVYRMKPEDLHAGRALCLSLMGRLQECIASDMWPGCAPDLQYLDLPPWAAGPREQDQEAW